VYSLSCDLVSIILLWCGKRCQASSGKQHVLWYQKSCLLSSYDLFMKQDMLWCQKSCCQNRWWLLLQYTVRHPNSTFQHGRIPLHVVCGKTSNPVWPSAALIQKTQKNGKNEFAALASGACIHAFLVQRTPQQRVLNFSFLIRIMDASEIPF